MVLRKNREVKKCCGVEEGSVSVDCKDDFVKNKGKVRWKSPEVEEKIFGEDCRSGCMQN